MVGHFHYVKLRVSVIFMVFLVCCHCRILYRTNAAGEFELNTNQHGRNYIQYDTMTATTLRPVTHPCFECPTQTEKRQNLCSDQVVTFKFACTDSHCFKTNPCITPKPGCEKNKFKTSKPCCIAHMTDTYSKSHLRMLRKNKKNKIKNKLGLVV
ncbi:PREDICTED: uncharacterized protein LOC107170689 [Diuraphis noxia]|uniref:uncharacterized protein LOC107170689 n=1 Tax=Diuraphis noxia TaxID=143948 RepID=UPI00076359F2|nr:PREDICTED: uncharacterized protein LOC107170689 [Diuraphis noxia]